MDKFNEFNTFPTDSDNPLTGDEMPDFLRDAIREMMLAKAMRSAVKAAEETFEGIDAAAFTEGLDGLAKDAMTGSLVYPDVPEGVDRVKLQATLGLMLVEANRRLTNALNEVKRLTATATPPANADYVAVTNLSRGE